MIEPKKLTELKSRSREVIFLVIAFFTFLPSLVFSQDQGQSNGDVEWPVATQTTKGLLVTCGTGGGETPFTVQILPDTIYNGYDVTCSDSCTGRFIAVVIGGSGNFIYQWFGSSASSINTQPVWDSVCDQGNIQVVVTDVTQGISCGASHTPIVPAPPQALNFSFVDATCDGFCDGSATQFPVFGVSPYTFLWTSGETTQNASALCAGPNTLTITDDNGCTFDTTVTVSAPPPISPNLTVYPVSCNNVCDGSIVSNPSGGNGGPFTWSWDDPLTQIVDSAIGLCELITYTVTVTDIMGCIQTASGTVPDRDSITITASVVSDPTCFGFCDGEISLGISGGCGSYTAIVWAEGVLGGGIIPFTPSGGLLNPNNFCANTPYKVYVTDICGCTDSLQLPMLTEPTELIIAETHSDLLCFGDGNGSITLTPTGGTPFVPAPEYIYTWALVVPGSGVIPGSQNQSTLSGGEYEIIVEDAQGCIATDTIVIFEPDQIYVNGIDIDNVCYDSTNASIDLSVTGGMGPGVYSYSWAGPNSFTSTLEDLSNLIDSGSYTVSIVDTNLCSYDTTFIISTPGELFANATVTPVDCNGGTTGEICLNPTNGTTPYEYDIPVSGVYDAVSCSGPLLAAGSYTVSVRDSNMCVKDTIIVVAENTPITAIMSSSNSSCGANNGSVSAAISGGAGGGTYEWTNACGFPSPVFGNPATGLGACCYDLTYTDAAGCIYTDQACVVDDSAPTGTFVTQDLNCFQSCDGSIVSTLSGGLLPYVVSWSSPTYPAFTAATEDVFALCAGDYTITVTDANGCVFSQTLTITEPAQMMAGTSVITDVLCFGDSTGTIDITVTGGTVAGAYGYSWTGPGFTSVAEDLTLLAPGTYCVHVTDDNACFLDTCMDVNEPLPVSATYTTNNAQCSVSDGDATIFASGGTTPPGYFYNWYTIPATTVTVSGLGLGVYPVEVTDGNGCVDTVQVAVSEDNGPTIVVDGSTMISCNGVCDGDISTTVSGANPFTLSWSNGSSAEDLTGLCAGTYVLTATDDITGCQVLVSIEITEPAVYDIPGAVSDPPCFGGTGIIDISPTGGTGPYTIFDWDNDGTGDNDDLEDLVIGDGTYNIIAYDANGCIAAGTFTVTEPSGITSVTSSIQSTDCTASDGSVTVVGANGTPGVPPNEYSYLWYMAGDDTAVAPPIGNTATVIGLLAGCYDVYIADINNCVVQDVECFTPNGVPALLETHVDVTCFSSTDGSITITTPFVDSLVWTGGVPAIPDNTNPATGLIPGSYTVQLTDNGCVSSVAVNILEPLEITMTETLVNPPCAGAATGSISLVINDAVGITGIVWTGGTTVIPPGTNPALNLEAGTYTATITDANGCTSVGTYQLNDNPTMVLTTSNVSTSCILNDGQVSVVATGGTVAVDYVYQWDDVPGAQTTATATGLGVGTYTVIVTDDLLCTATATATVSTFNPPVITLVSQSDVTCFGDDDGGIFVNVSGGTTPPAYTFLWSPSGVTTQNLTNVGPGYDTLTVTDGAGCIATYSDSIFEPALLTVTGIDTDILCNGDATGEIAITVAGGVAPYTFAWTNSSGTPIFSVEDINGLLADTYDVVVTDANGCTATYSGTVNEPTIITLTNAVLTPTCLLSDGAVSIAGTGGTGAYTYNWEDVVNPGVSISTNDTLLNIPAGGYMGCATDVNGCTVCETIAVSDGAGPTVTNVVTNVLCYGNANGAIDITVSDPLSTFVWTGPLPFPGAITEDISGVEAGIYTDQVTDVNGCVTVEVITIGGPTTPIATTAVITDLTCFNDASGAINVTTTGGTPSVITGYTFSWTGPGFTSTFEDIASLDSGAYVLTVTDSNACNYSVTYNVTQPDSIAINPTVVDATCGLADGSITTAVTGGDGTYTYAWTDLTGVLVFFGNASEINLPAGVYEIVVTDGTGCSNLENVTVTDANGATLTAVVTDVACNGMNNGTIDLTVGGPNTYNFAWTGPGAFVDPGTEDLLAGDLAPGTYSVLVTDNALGCVSALSVDVLEPPVLTISGLDTSLSCFASLDGSIDITVGGGTPFVPAPDYTYSWTSTNGNFIDPLTEDLIALDTGTYTVTATDLNGCTIAAQYAITQPNSMLLSSVVVIDSCFQGGNGAIDITVTQGTTPYTYTWTPGGNNEDLINLLAGTYTLNIADSNGCQKDTTFIITESPQIIADVTVTDANCLLSDGSAVSNASGGIAPYTYDWDGISTNADTTNVPSGQYNLGIIDDYGCRLDTIITISDIGGPTITVDNIIDVSCFGGSDGGIDVTVTGAGGYIYLWNTNPPSQVEDLINAPAGDHTLQVTDALGCTSFETATIGTPTQVTATYTVVDATCGICDGEATVTASGGTPGYTYNWSDGQTTVTAGSLCPGVQTVQITDFNNCVVNIDVLVSDVEGPTDYTMITTDVACSGDTDGTADVAATGGTLPYTYFWTHDGTTTSLASNLGANTYYVEITDSNDCVLVGEATITESTLIESSATITPSTCGGTDGSIITTTSGGSGLYTYDWELGAGTAQDTIGAGEGVYSLTIDDGVCSITEIYTIPGIGAPEVSLVTVPTNCFNDTTGSIFSTVIGNIGNVSYLWHDGVNSMVQETSDIINVLPPGTYSVQVLDSATMCYAYATGVITSPDSIVLSIPTIIDATCGGVCDGEAYVVPSGGTLPYSFVWTGNLSDSAGAVGLCAGPDTVTITDANFCTVMSEIIVNEPFPISIIVDSITDAFCVNTTDGAIYITANGGDANYTYSWVSIPAGFIASSGFITGLLPMDYELSITDGNGCTYMDTIPVDTLNILIGNAGLDSNVCAGSCIDLIGTAIGTTTYTLEWFDLTGTSVSTNDTFQLCPTTANLESYVLVATDLSCTYSDTVDVLVNPLPIVDAGVDYIEIFGTTVVLGGSPTSNSGTLQWSPTTNFTDTSGTDANPEIMVNNNLEYVVTITDSNGCVNSDTVNVEIYPEILFPNGFSPNGDGINDTWQIDLMSEFPDAVIEVYNRWGQQLFMSVGYVQQFDGTYKGKDLPVGTYYYIIVLNHPEYPDAYTGPITIMR